MKRIFWMPIPLSGGGPGQTQLHFPFSRPVLRPVFMGLPANTLETNITGSVHLFEAVRKTNLDIIIQMPVLLRNTESSA